MVVEATLSLGASGTGDAGKGTKGREWAWWPNFLARDCEKKSGETFFNQ